MYDVTRVSRYIASAQGFVAKSADDADIDYAAGGFYAGAGTAAAPSLTFFGDTDTGLYRSAANTLGVAVAGALDFSFSANAFNVLAGSSIAWVDSATLVLGTGSDDTISHDGTLTTWTHTTGDLVIDNTDTNDQIIVRVGTDTTATGIEFRNNSDVFMWKVEPISATAGRLMAADASTLIFGAGSDDTIQHDGTNTIWAHITGDLTFDNQLVTGSTIMLLGTDTTATDFQVQNNSAVAILTVLPESASGGTTVAMGLRTVPVTAAAITTTRTLTAADSGGTFSVAKTSAYTVTLPAPLQGLRFKFLILDAGANVVTFASSGANVFGMLNINNVLTQVNGSTNVLSAATASIGDWLEFVGIDSTHYLVTGGCKDAADLSVS